MATDYGVDDVVAAADMPRPADVLVFEIFDAAVFNEGLTTTLDDALANLVKRDAPSVVPAATTLGAFAQLPLTERLSVVLRGENLTGERIVTRNQGGSIDLGTPTTVWGGIRLTL